jgi:redox-sensitive bicupin YhaK (pirin superfamily)
MINVRHAEDRGHTQIDWLNSKHTFSFGGYRDFAHMGFGCLRVINDDIVAPGEGFQTHGHKDMEIITYVLSGALSHKDSLGTGSTIWPGDVQKMSAGTGIMHSEFNASDNDPVHFLQIWVVPNKTGVAPAYFQEHFPRDTREGALKLVASSDGREGSIPLYQDFHMYAGIVRKNETLTLPVAPQRQVWVHVARGEISLNGHALTAGDGAAITNENNLVFQSDSEGEMLVFEMEKIS